MERRHVRHVRRIALGSMLLSIILYPAVRGADHEWYRGRHDVQMTRTDQRRAHAFSSHGILYPLDFVYTRAGVTPPVAVPVSPADIPPPYRSLLAHENDMTPTLEQHFGGRVTLRVLSSFSKGSSYFRRVLLAHEYSGRPVEMGATRVKLEVFSPKIRAQILRNEIPLGRLLRDGGVEFKSRPRLYLAITPNPEMMGVFWMREPRTLYGRQTEIIQGATKIGDIIEVLPLV